MKALIRAIELAGGQSALARILTEMTGKLVRQSTVSLWLHRDGKVPPEMAPYIEAAVDKRVSRQELCPGFPWGEITPKSRARS